MSISQFPPAAGVSLATTYKVQPGDNPIPFPKGLFKVDSSVSNTYPFTFNYPNSFEPQPAVESDSTVVTVGDTVDKIVMPKGFSQGNLSANNTGTNTYAMLQHPNSNIIVSGRKNSIGNNAPYYSNDGGATWTVGNASTGYNAAINVILTGGGHNSADRPHEAPSGSDPFAAFLGNAANNGFGQYVNDYRNSFSMNFADARPNNNSSARDAVMYSKGNYSSPIVVTTGGTIRMNNNNNNWTSSNTTVAGISTGANALTYDGEFVYIADGTTIYKNNSNNYDNYSPANNTALPEGIAQRGMAGTSNEILAVTNNLEVLKSTDQAQNWSSAATIGNAEGTLHDFRYFGTRSLGVYVISTNSGYVHYSIDKGESFTTERPQNTVFQLSGYKFISDSRVKFLFGSDSTGRYSIIDEIPHLPSFLTLTQLSELTDLTT